MHPFGRGTSIWIEWAGNRPEENPEKTGGKDKSGLEGLRNSPVVGRPSQFLERLAIFLDYLGNQKLSLFESLIEKILATW